MPVATIVPKYINQPKPGKKEGSIRLADDSFYGVPPALIPQFQMGGTYEVEYTERDWQGKTFRSIKSVKQVGAPQANSGGMAPAKGGYGSTDMATAERILVCGALNAAIRAGQINVMNTADVHKAIDGLRATWRQTFGNKQVNPEMGD